MWYHSNRHAHWSQRTRREQVPICRVWGSMWGKGLPASYVGLNLRVETGFQIRYHFDDWIELGPGSVLVNWISLLRSRQVFPW